MKTYVFTDGQPNNINNNNNNDNNNNNNNNNNNLSRLITKRDVVLRTV